MGKMIETTTAVNCEEEGHCLHEGTAVGTFYCCKCGQYIGYKTPYSEVYKPPLYDLVSKGLNDIREGRVKKIPNIRSRGR